MSAFKNARTISLNYFRIAWGKAARVHLKKYVNEGTNKWRIVAEYIIVIIISLIFLLVVKGKAYNYTIPSASYSESFYGPIRRGLQYSVFPYFPLRSFYCSLCCSPINSDNCSAVWTAGNLRPSSYPTPRLGLPFSEEKRSIPRNTEQTEFSIHSVAERNTLGIPFQAITRKIKNNSEFRSEELRRKEKYSDFRNFVPNHFAIDKNSEFCSLPFHREEQSAEDNKFGIPFRTILQKRKTLRILFQNQY